MLTRYKPLDMARSRYAHHVSDSARKPHRLVERATVSLRTEAARPSEATLEATHRDLSCVRTRDQGCATTPLVTDWDSVDR